MPALYRRRSSLRWLFQVLVPGGLYWVPAGLWPWAGFERSSGNFLVFSAGLATLFVSKPFFHRFKHAVIAFDQPGADLPALWQHYFRVRNAALWVACLPALAGLAGKLAGMDGVAVFLLGLCSLMVLFFYRTPAQLWARMP